MALIKDALMFYAKLDPKRPNPNFDKNNPTWEVQIRTKDKKIRDEWKAMNLNVKLVEIDARAESGKPGEKDYKPAVEAEIYYRVNLKKKSKKADGTAAKPVDVVSGNLKPIDPSSIGNGSIGNIRVFQRAYKVIPKEGETGGTKEGITSMLMAVQITKHIVYVQRPHDDDFELQDTETIDNSTDGSEAGAEAEDDDKSTGAKDKKSDEAF